MFFILRNNNQCNSNALQLSEVLKQKDTSPNTRNLRETRVSINEYQKTISKEWHGCHSKKKSVPSLLRIHFLTSSSDVGTKHEKNCQWRKTGQEERDKSVRKTSEERKLYSKLERKNKKKRPSRGGLEVEAWTDNALHSASVGLNPI